MYDIHFLQKCNDLKKKIVQGEIELTRDEVYAKIEELRGKKPHIFNIETTNACNMTCKMCPRTTLMKRNIQHMDMDLYRKIIKQLKPYSQVEIDEFWDFVLKEHGITHQERNENSFYFYMLCDTVMLHGYGEPLMDPRIIERVQICTDNNIPTYFSCVPENIDIDKFRELLKAGVKVVKFSMDALDDEKAKSIRGKNACFTDAYKKICGVLEIIKKDPSIDMTVVVSMIAMSNKEEDIKMQKDFLRLWADKPIYAYVKSQDNRWYMEEDENLECKNHFEKQYCEYPFTSMAIMADGSVVPCTQDYNMEMTFGNANEQSLEEIWNSKSFSDFRRGHVTGAFVKKTKCVDRCDQKLLCDRLDQKEMKI